MIRLGVSNSCGGFPTLFQEGCPSGYQVDFIEFGKPLDLDWVSYDLFVVFSQDLLKAGEILHRCPEKVLCYFSQEPREKEFLFLRKHQVYPFFHRGNPQEIEQEIFFYLNKRVRLGDSNHTKLYVKSLFIDGAVLNKISHSKTSILIEGETGTGKSYLAKLIHRESSRREGPFQSVNCGAIPENLIESELFGHEKGAFTGAVHKKKGKFELCENGTLFLDEVSSLSPQAQVKLLEVLQEKVVYPVGAEEPVPINTRLIFASNEDLEELIEKGAFRRDLYYRINVFKMKIPPLRNRLEEIQSLCRDFVLKFREEFHSEVLGLSFDSYQALLNYDYPGNVRELENLLERAFLLETSSQITLSSLPFAEGTAEEIHIRLEEEETLSEMKDRVLIKAEREYLASLFAKYQGKIAAISDHAGVSTRQLLNLSKKHQIRKSDFRK